jgi:hypothetical protein
LQPTRALPTETGKCRINIISPYTTLVFGIETQGIRDASGEEISRGEVIE